MTVCTTTYHSKQYDTFWKCPMKYATFRLVNIQRQPNSSDCGLFAIAAATEIVHGKDPLLSYWNTSILREHLTQCLEQKKMECFPQSKCPRVPPGNRFRKVERRELHFVCRMPNNKNKSMIQCGNCSGWLHENALIWTKTSHTVK